MMKCTVKYLATPIIISLLFIGSKASFAFCGFYVAQGGAELFNKASQVVIVRNENKTVLSMLNDYQGPLDNFALIVPVPTVIQRGQINLGDPALFKRIDAFTSPRLVEYFDPDPCIRQTAMPSMAFSGLRGGDQTEKSRSEKALGVTVEDSYTVGEYDIVILSAKQSDGLEKWLSQNGYSIPKGAEKILKPYINQNMKFFVAKVNLSEAKKNEFNYLRPLQIAYESEKFILPIRLGMANAKGHQELIVYILSQKGRVETTNYQTVRIPSDLELPQFVREDFPDFYTKLFNEQSKQDAYKKVYLEYFWDMSWCDPCAADPLTTSELRKLGVFWLEDRPQATPPLNPTFNRLPILPSDRSQPVKVTRLHFKYSEKTFPQDLFFQETADTKNFQARYVLRRAWEGSPTACKEAKVYLKDLKRKQELRAENYARLTGTSLTETKKKLALDIKEKPWWERLWQSVQ